MRVGTAAIIAVNALVYLVFQGGPLALPAATGIEFRCNAMEYGLVPYEVTHPGEQLADPYCQAPAEEGSQAGEEHGHEEPRSDPGLVADAPTPVTAVTATFMHGSLLHLVLSMVFLVIFGGRLERRAGTGTLLGLYVAGAAAGAVTLVALAPDLPIVTIGSSGAVAAVVGAALVQFPRASLTFFAVPVGVLAVLWAAAQLLIAGLDLGQPVAGAGGDIAYLAPAGALLVGAAISVWARPRCERIAAT